jgi:DNA-binding transcriptional MerR regulator
MNDWLEWLDEIQEAKRLGLTTKEIREWLDALIKERNLVKQDA